MLNGLCSKSREDSCSLLLSLVNTVPFSVLFSVHFLVNASLASSVCVVSSCACPLQVFTSVPEKVFLFLLFVNLAFVCVHDDSSKI